MESLKCPVCSTRRLVRDSLLQKVMCFRGHVISEYREEYADEERGAESGRTIRMKKTKKINTSTQEGTYCAVAMNIFLKVGVLVVQSSNSFFPYYNYSDKQLQSMLVELLCIHIQETLINIVCHLIQKMNFPVRLEVYTHIEKRRFLVQILNFSIRKE